MRKQWRLIIVIGLAAQASVAAAKPIVLTESGAISGASDRGLISYKGVPFAAAPVGNLRWRPPAPHAPWTGTRKATAFS